MKVGHAGRSPSPLMDKMESSQKRPVGTTDWTALILWPPEREAGARFKRNVGRKTGPPPAPPRHAQDGISVPMMPCARNANQLDLFGASLGTSAGCRPVDPAKQQWGGLSMPKRQEAQGEHRWRSDMLHGKAERPRPSERPRPRTRPSRPGARTTSLGVSVLLAARRSW